MLLHILVTALTIFHPNLGSPFASVSWTYSRVWLVPSTHLPWCSFPSNVVFSICRVRAGHLLPELSRCTKLSKESLALNGEIIRIACQVSFWLQVLPVTWPSVTALLGLPKHLFLVFCFLFLIFWPRCAACGILVPWSGLEPASPALGEQSLNHWTDREVPLSWF